MSYQDALTKAWGKLQEIKRQDAYSVKLLCDEYDINLSNQTVASLSCNVPARDHVAILVLHYLIRKIEGLPNLSEKWISFPELEGGKGYYPTFKQRVIEPIIRKYGKSPEGLLSLIERFSAKNVQIGDFSLVLEVLPNVPILITFWKADEEFLAEANVLFDESIKDVFSTEDIVVMAEIVVKNI